MGQEPHTNDIRKSPANQKRAQHSCFKEKTVVVKRQLNTKEKMRCLVLKYAPDLMYASTSILASRNGHMHVPARIRACTTLFRANIHYINLGK